MPFVILVVVAAVIALLAACAPRTFQRVRSKIAARVQLRDGLAWRGDTPPGGECKPLVALICSSLLLRVIVYRPSSRGKGWQ